MRFATLFVALLLAPGAHGAPPEEPPAAAEGASLYQQNCAQCHGPDRLGAMGPALLPENLVRLPRKRAAGVIREGRPATQMPAFGDRLSATEIDALVQYIYRFTPLHRLPPWGMREIDASQTVPHPYGSLPDRPVFDADPWNLFVVVELGDHHATILDGDRLEPIFRFKTRFALHGGPKYSADGRYVFFASRDGWISKFDLWNLRVTAEIRAGINTRNIAVSPDGRYVMVANYLPHTLVILDGRNLDPIKVIPVEGGDGTTSRVSAVYSAPPRASFIAALKDLPEVWEISWENPPPAGFGQWIHDYRADSGDLGETAPFPVRRFRAEGFLDDFFFDPDYWHLIGTSRDGLGQVLDLDSGRVVATLDLGGMPHLGSGITWRVGDRLVLATPHLKEGKVSIIDMESWKPIKEITTLGPGFFMRSHEKSPYAWVDVFFGPDRDAMHVIDKQKLEIVETLRPAPGKTSAHVEFDRYGRYALVSIWDMDGAVVVYDARTLKEIKRIPMKKPSGKYNVWNKTHLSTGTSH